MTNRTCNNIGAKLTFKLANWLTVHKDSLHGKSRVEIADKATEDLGFKVTDNNVSAAIEVADVEIRPAHRGGRSSTTPAKDRIRSLAQELRDLCVHLGNVPSARLIALAQGKALDDAEEPAGQ